MSRFWHQPAVTSFHYRVFAFTHNDELRQAELPDAARGEEHLHVPQRGPVLRGSPDGDQPEESVQLWDFAEGCDRRDTGAVWSRAEHLHAERRSQSGLFGQPAERGAVRRSWERKIQKDEVRRIGLKQYNDNCIHLLFIADMHMYCELHNLLSNYESLIWRERQ